jgi:hypothetical protein
MFNDDDVKSTIIKALTMLAVVAAEWWMMQPYHEPVLARLWYWLARYCYRLAHGFGSLGLEFEYRYNEVIA